MHRVPARWLGRPPDFRWTLTSIQLKAASFLVLSVGEGLLPVSGGWERTSRVEGKDDDIEGDSENSITAVMRGETYLKTTTDRKDVPLQDETCHPGPC